MSQAILEPPVDSRPTFEGLSRPDPSKPMQPVMYDAGIRRLYFQGLGAVYVIAFLSLWVQIHGLVGEQGLLPISRFLSFAHEKLGSGVYQVLPSLVWLSASDATLHLLCAVGTGLSVCLIVGVAPRLVLIGLWMVYLSLCVAGQAFLSFQWDALLLEMTICSVLYAPRGLWPRWQTASQPFPVARWLLWGLAFKLMFLSGVTKLLSGDASWTDGTALQFHYFSQPIPNWISWYAYQSPLWFHKLSLVIMFVVEVLLPFLVLAGSRGRAIFGIATMMLMVTIEFTGNFGFFNLQTAVLCLPLLNDRLLQRWLPRWFVAGPSTELVAVRSSLRRFIAQGATATILLLSLLTLVREMVRTVQPERSSALVVTVAGWADGVFLSWSESSVLKLIAPFRSINGYGLFRVMTTRRPEIVVEMSDDGTTWTACEFPYKVGQVDRAPPIVAPHMPRLDWQMWFAALNPRGNGDWLGALTQRILEGNATTARLLGKPELVNHPPKFVRLAYYDYKFSSPDQKQATGAWWSRSHDGYLTGPMTRR